MIVGFIPARKGSKRLKNKNIRSFCGNPLIHYTIDIAQRSGIFDKIIVSTDSEKIASIANKYTGVTVLKRPDELATDYTTTGEAAKHTLNAINATNVQAFITLQITNPLRSTSLIQGALKTYQSLKGYDSLISLSKSDLKMGIIKNKQYIPGYTPGQRGQDLKETFYENGSIYISSPETIKEANIFGEKIFPYITDSIYGKIDIDTLEDFEISELIFSKYKTLFYT